jgi:ribonuclease P protein component
MNKVSSSGLRKHEIIRGYESFNGIFKNSKQFKTKFLTGYLRTEKIELIQNNSPLSKSNFIVGFIISKKSLKKANKRIRIKRLLREAFRLNRENCFNHKLNPEYKISLIIGINNDLDIMKSIENKEINFKNINDDMKILLDSINNFLVLNTLSR